MWYRLVALLWWRGQHTHPALKRMLKHVALHADEHGVLRDIPALLAAYCARHAVGSRTAWYDLMDRAVEAGLVRQLFAAAPERQAVYILCLDVAALPADLPADLLALVRRYVDNPAVAAKGRPTRAQRDRALAECQVVRYGSARRAPIMEQAGCGRLHTSPFTREGSPPSPQPRQSQSSQRARRLPFGGQNLGEERSAALNFVKELCPVWAAQRSTGEIPSDAELAELARLAGLLLRRMPRHEVAELLTAQVASAADLAGVLRWRIGRTLAGLRRSERRAAELAVDDDGARHAAWLESNATAAARQAAVKAGVVEQARRRAEELRGRRAAAQDRHRRPQNPAPGRSVPPEAIAATEPPRGLEMIPQDEQPPALPHRLTRARAIARAAADRAARGQSETAQPVPRRLPIDGELSERLAALAAGARPVPRTQASPATAAVKRTALQARLAALVARARE
ncbi:hypothetical protein [Sphaerisporangium dianthi]|uniref:Uncharacterized protein n=1 Tax=Sphaerisporangium dianthi TaxID=1436120 RepID=A0ABV9CW72_9ACTN